MRWQSPRRCSRQRSRASPAWAQDAGGASHPPRPAQRVRRRLRRHGADPGPAPSDVGLRSRADCSQPARRTRSTASRAALRRRGVPAGFRRATSTRAAEAADAVAATGARTCHSTDGLTTAIGFRPRALTRAESPVSPSAYANSGSLRVRAGTRTSVAEAMVPDCEADGRTPRSRRSAARPDSETRFRAEIHTSAC